MLASIWLPFFFQFSKAGQLLKLLLYAAEPAKSMAAPAANATPMGEECRGHRDSDGAARQCRQRIQASSPSSRWCSSSSTRSSWPFGIEDSVGAAEPLLALAGSRFKLHGELHGRGTLHPRSPSLIAEQVRGRADTDCFMQPGGHLMMQCWSLR